MLDDAVEGEELDGSIERRCCFQATVLFTRVFEYRMRGTSRRVNQSGREGRCHLVEAEREIQVVRVSSGSFAEASMRC